MKEFTIPLLPISLAEHCDEKMLSHEVEGIELEYPWVKYKPRSLFTGVFIAAGIDGIACSFCAEVPKNAVVCEKKEHKSKIFEDDCLEFFIHPAHSTIYYGWEINSEGFCLDYRTGIGDKGKETILNSMKDPTEYDGKEIVNGFSCDVIMEEKITFDYNWKSNANISSFIEDEFWYAEIFIPWKDFACSLEEMQNSDSSKDDAFSSAKLEGKTWRFTCNRIDTTGQRIQKQKTALKKIKTTGTPKKINPGLQSLLDETDFPSFHQSYGFAAATFKKQ